MKFRVSIRLLIPLLLHFQHSDQKEKHSGTSLASNIREEWGLGEEQGARRYGGKLGALWGPKEGLSWTDELSEDQDDVERLPEDWEISGEPWLRKKRWAKHRGGETGGSRKGKLDDLVFNEGAGQETGDLNWEELGLSAYHKRNSSESGKRAKAKDYPEEDYYDYSNPQSVKDSLDPHASNLTKDDPAQHHAPNLHPESLHSSATNNLSLVDVLQPKRKYEDKGSHQPFKTTLFGKTADNEQNRRKLTDTEKELLEAKSAYNEKIVGMDLKPKEAKPQKKTRLLAEDNKQTANETDEPVADHASSHSNLLGESRKLNTTSVSDTKPISEITDLTKPKELTKGIVNPSVIDVNDKQIGKEESSEKMEKDFTKVEEPILNVDKIPVYSGGHVNEPKKAKVENFENKNSVTGIDERKKNEKPESEDGSISEEKDSVRAKGNYSDLLARVTLMSTSHNEDRGYWLGGLAAVLTTLLGTPGRFEDKEGRIMNDVHEGLRDFCNVVNNDRSEGQRASGMAEVLRDIMERLALMANSVDSSLLGENLDKLEDFNKMPNQSQVFDAALLNRAATVRYNAQPSVKAGSTRNSSKSATSGDRRTGGSISQQRPREKPYWEKAMSFWNHSKTTPKPRGDERWHFNHGLKPIREDSTTTATMNTPSPQTTTTTAPTTPGVSKGSPRYKGNRGDFTKTKEVAKGKPLIEDEDVKTKQKWNGPEFPSYEGSQEEDEGEGKTSMEAEDDPDGMKRIRNWAGQEYDYDWDLESKLHIGQDAELTSPLKVVQLDNFTRTIVDDSFAELPLEKRSSSNASQEEFKVYDYEEPSVDRPVKTKIKDISKKTQAELSPNEEAAPLEVVPNSVQDSNQTSYHPSVTGPKGLREGEAVPGGGPSQEATSGRLAGEIVSSILVWVKGCEKAKAQLGLSPEYGCPSLAFGQVTNDTSNLVAVESEEVKESGCKDTNCKKLDDDLMSFLKWLLTDTEPPRRNPKRRYSARKTESEFLFRIPPNQDETYYDFLDSPVSNDLFPGVDYQLDSSPFDIV